MASNHTDILNTSKNNLKLDLFDEYTNDYVDYVFTYNKPGKVNFENTFLVPKTNDMTILDSMEASFLSFDQLEINKDTNINCNFNNYKTDTQELFGNTLSNTSLEMSTTGNNTGMSTSQGYDIFNENIYEKEKIVEQNSYQDVDILNDSCSSLPVCDTDYSMSFDTSMVNNHYYLDYSSYMQSSLISSDLLESEAFKQNYISNSDLSSTFEISDSGISTECVLSNSRNLAANSTPLDKSSGIPTISCDTKDDWVSLEQKNDTLNEGICLSGCTLSRKKYAKYRFYETDFSDRKKRFKEILTDKDYELAIKNRRYIINYIRRLYRKYESLIKGANIQSKLKNDLIEITKKIDNFLYSTINVIKFSMYDKIRKRAIINIKELKALLAFTQAVKNEVDNSYNSMCILEYGINRFLLYAIMYFEELIEINERLLEYISKKHLNKIPSCSKI